MPAQDPEEFALLEDLLQSIVDALQARQHAEPGWRTGLADLDALTGGLRRGHLWAVTGSPGVGKTVFALTLARAAAVSQSVPTWYASRRETSIELGARLLISHSRVPLHRFSTGTMSDDEWARLARGMGEAADAPIRFGRSQIPAPDVLDRDDIEAGVLVVDDLPADDRRPGHLRELKALAVARKCAVVAVVQHGPGERRHAADDSAAESADLVLRVEREDHRVPDSPRVGEVDLVVTHHQHGLVATLTVAGQFHYGRLVDMAA